jgi:hypothetical protein
MMAWLAQHEAELYPRIGSLGETARRTVEQSFAAEGMLARCTGGANAAIPASSVGAVLFPYREDTRFTSPDQTKDPDLCDTALAETVLQLALLLEDVHVMHGLGAVSAAHTPADIARLGEACRRAARRIKAAG